MICCSSHKVPISNFTVPHDYIPSTMFSQVQDKFTYRHIANVIWVVVNYVCTAIPAKPSAVARELNAWLIESDLSPKIKNSS